MSEPTHPAQHVLGRSGVPVSMMGLGTAPLSVALYENGMVPDAQALDTIHMALAQGVTLFDTAPSYGDGRSEMLLGEALADTPRAGHLLCTKARRDPGPWRASHFSAAGVRASLLDSLARMRADFADIALIHDPIGAEDSALAEALPALQQLRAEGRVRLIGVGTTCIEPLQRFIREADCDVFLLAGHYTLLDHDGLATLDQCAQRGIGVMMGAVLNTGILATGAHPGARYNYHEASPEILARVARIEAVCARQEVPLLAAALQFPLAHPAVSCIVVGAQSPAEVSANLAAISRPIPPAFWADLQAEGLLPAGLPVP